MRSHPEPPAAAAPSPRASSHNAPVLPGRLAPTAMFPAGRRDIRARFVPLASGVRVRVVESGPPEGPPIFFVHGWACSVYSFRHSYTPLAAAGFRVVSADLKGHGLSDKPTVRGEYATEAMVAHVLALLDALGLDRPVLAGHSLGGALALDVALRVPSRIARLVLLDSVGLSESPLVRVVRLLTPRAIAPLLPRLVRRWMVPLVLRLAYGGRGHFSARDVDEYFAPTQFPETIEALRLMAHEFTWSPVPTARLGTLRVPTLVVFGSRDRFVGARAARRLVASLPAARFEVVEGAGHVAPEEAPDEVNRLMIDFLAAERARESGAA